LASTFTCCPPTSTASTDRVTLPLATGFIRIPPALKDSSTVARFPHRRSRRFRARAFTIPLRGFAAPGRVEMPLAVALAGTGYATIRLPRQQRRHAAAKEQRRRLDEGEEPLAPRSGLQAGPDSTRPSRSAGSRGAGRAAGGSGAWLRRSG